MSSSVVALLVGGAVGASFTGVTSSVMLPSAGPVSAASRIRVVMVVSTSLSVAGTNATAASAAFTCATLPVMVHIPVAAV